MNRNPPSFTQNPPRLAKGEGEGEGGAGKIRKEKFYPKKCDAEGEKTRLATWPDKRRDTDGQRHRHERCRYITFRPETLIIG